MDYLQLFTMLKDFLLVTIAVVTIYYGLKNRRNSLREDLRKREIDILLEIIGKYELIDNLLVDYDEEKTESPKEAENISILIYKTLDDIYVLYAKIQLLTDDNVYMILHKYRANMYKVVKESIANGYSERNENIIEMELDFIDDLREHLCVDKLSQETKKLLK